MYIICTHSLLRSRKPLRMLLLCRQGGRWPQQANYLLYILYYKSKMSRKNELMFAIDDLLRVHQFVWPSFARNAKRRRFPFHELHVRFRISI